MIPEEILTLSKNPENAAKTYSRIIFEIANGTNIKLLNNFSRKQLDRFIKAVIEELKPHLN